MSDTLKIATPEDETPRLDLSPGMSDGGRWIDIRMCGCCGALRPRYKKLVDAIFPEDPQDGLVKTNMDKLTFYTIRAPEKLDRVGEYLAQRLSRDVSRNRKGYVVIAMEALDQLLLACHAQSINLFVESFLKMVSKLLESRDPDLQILGSTSFVKFTNIEEDTPSYHRRYDFFVSKFSAMAHSNNQAPDVRIKVRVAGLRGLQGVVKKTSSDELQVNIWDKVHMDKIVPSLLYNMHEEDSPSPSPSDDTQHASQLQDTTRPTTVAETCLRDLVCRAAFGCIKSVLKPALSHLDNHQLWVPNRFAVKCFKIIMYSMQSQYSHVAIQSLLSHLDDHTRDSARIKASIVGVLRETVSIAAAGSIGPSVLEVFNTLLRHLRLSIDYQLTGRRGSQGSIHKQPINEEEEKLFQEAIITTVGAFATILPDYQKIEIMMFIMGKVPIPPQNGDSNLLSATGVQGLIYFQNLRPNFSQEEGNLLLQNMLLKSLHQVALAYTSVSMTTTFTSTAFLDPLLRVSLVADAHVRLIVQQILHTLIDRHGNCEKLQEIRIPKYINDLDLKVEKCSRQDLAFMRKHGPQFYSMLYENLLQHDNSDENFHAIYCTMALLCVEMGGEDVLVELLRLTLGLQEIACKPQEENDLSTPHICKLHAVLAAYLNLISQLTAIPALCQHVTQVLETRKQEAPYFLPETAFLEGNSLDQVTLPDTVDTSLLFHQNAINEAMASSGHEVSRLSQPFVPLRSDFPSQSRYSMDVQSINIELDQVDTPGRDRKHPGEEITFETLKKTLTEKTPDAEDDEARRREVVEKFQNAPFEEIAAHSEARSQQLNNKLNEIMDMVSKPSVDASGRVVSLSGPFQVKSVPVYEMQFPDLCVY
ncbi:protein EFR3 homolog B-like isoform X3 [Branchiostoma floridae]|uniref:Protein EFR3 homolog B-like isoform X3 n=1 Tax=Branchiostoma floridae TaxID=7739 RepID=A0A9J7HM12_BRAFL|nr:protein EFR3 homolog B-like isoform X3 [Branchiostoma floridae]